MRTDDFDYELPPELIAQEPAGERAQSRLLVLRASTGEIEHSRFTCLGTFLRRGDVLIANRTRVVPARLYAQRPTGGAVELLLLRDTGENVWEAMARPARKLKAGQPLAIEGAPLTAMPVARRPEGTWLLRFEGNSDPRPLIRSAGRLALPPYIRQTSAPESRYQTVYADRDGSIAAPTAGLHFTPELLDELRNMGIVIEFITLHVGPGTFKPVTAATVEEHQMHAEWGEVTKGTAATINRVRETGGRVIAVGTTTTRLLESAWDGHDIAPFCGETDRFIYPGYTFQAIDGLITNFHLPRSTLLMLVSALAGRENVLRAYREAIRAEYRFYSFGDAMLIL